MNLKLYKRPLAVLTITGENVRITPGILAKFSTALAEKMINIYNVSIGEYSMSFFVDEDDTEKAKKTLYDVVTKSPSFSSLTSRGSIGMLSISSAEFVDTPGVINSLTEPLAKNKINIIALSSSFDSILIFVDWKDARQAYEALHVAILQGLI